MGNRAFAHVGNDLHVLVGMGIKTGACLNNVIVDHPQGAKPHAVAIVILSKAEVKMRIKPAQVMATESFIGIMPDHFQFPFSQATQFDN